MPRHLVSCRFVRLLDRGLEEGREEPPKEENHEEQKLFPHKLRSYKYCWCDCEAVAKFTRCVS